MHRREATSFYGYVANVATHRSRDCDPNREKHEIAVVGPVANLAIEHLNGFGKQGKQVRLP